MFSIRKHVSVLALVFDHVRRKAGEVGAGRPAATGRLAQCQRNPVRGDRACSIDGRVRSTRLAWGVPDPVTGQAAGVTAGGDSVKRGAAKKLNHERRKGFVDQALASE